MKKILILAIGLACLVFAGSAYADGPEGSSVWIDPGAPMLKWKRATWSDNSDSLSSSIAAGEADTTNWISIKDMLFVVDEDGNEANYLYLVGYVLSGSDSLSVTAQYGFDGLIAVSTSLAGPWEPTAATAGEIAHMTPDVPWDRVRFIVTELESAAANDTRLYLVKPPAVISGGN